MIKLTIIDRSGSKKVVEASEGGTLMQVIRDNGFGELLAQCGGFCSCATCHAYILPDFPGTLPEMSEDEDGLLESSSHRTEQSRLTCQIPVLSSLDGLKVKIAPED